MTDRLIIVRAGDESIHTNWGAGNWDLINASYSKNPPPNSISLKGGKWEGIYKVFQAQPDLLHNYKTIWLPDDDIETNADDIEKFFALHEQYKLQLSQPSLAYDSFAIHPVLLQNPKFILRYTDFVEIMMPCFDTRLLVKVLPFFENNITGTYLDSIWHRFATPPYESAAIIDRVAMRHTRAVGVTTGSLINKENSKKDGAILMRKVAAVPKKLLKKLPRPLFYAAHLANGNAINGTRRTGAAVAAGFLPQLRKISRQTHIGSGYGKRGLPFLFFRFFRHILLRHLFHKPELTQL